MYSPARSTPSPHAQTYAAAMDYGVQVPVMLQGAAMYAHNVNPQAALYMYQQSIRQLRGPEARDAPPPIRSQVLDEFRANKARKWELRVWVSTFDFY